MKPREYGKNKISLARPPCGRCPAGQKRGWRTIACTVYGEATTKTCKTYLATYPPVGGVIRVVLMLRLARGNSPESTSEFPDVCNTPLGSDRLPEPTT